MINKENFKDLLKMLNFEEKGSIFSKHFSQDDFYLRVDFNTSKISYPTNLKVHGEFTTNFAYGENFVVFECINRLLEKGYKPQHIELEPKWDLGRGASGGRADIFVRNQEGKPLLIIECKTAGKEFEKEWKEMQIDGGQLFSYIEQEKDIEFVCLYASDFDVKGKISTEQRIVSHIDNEQIIREDPSLKDFKNAKNVKERYAVWKQTYQLEYTENGIFEADVEAYSIGKSNFTLNDLYIVSKEEDIQNKYHEFASILRKYNIAGRENAFDKIINLFLAKIVDEKHNPTNLQFRWKGIANDNYFAFIDRLQELYANGMKEFLKEEVTFIKSSKVYDAFHFFVNDPCATRDTVIKYFRQQKYFTNNDFSFIDVHNEKLFYQNVVVLRKMVQMIEGLQLNGDQQTQFLGDLFEGFLDKGVKQSEGQFFTPMPIVKFILMSLPLENIIKTHSEIPKAIDYACGAGHFLTELAAQIKPFIQKHKSELSHKDYFEGIYGIEKEYRLSKVAKVSSFMYSQDEINILYGDALQENQRVKDEDFQILVANPPFAVKGFLETLSEKEREKYKLSEKVSDLAKNNQIQCFFLERAKQLLNVGGVAGIIVPSSVLSNEDTMHIETRAMILEYFDIVSLVELGSKTFGETGTNTIVLFLRKKENYPPMHQHYKERVESWFLNNDDKKQKIFKDIYLLESYCQHQNISFEAYKNLLFAIDDIVPLKDLFEYELFVDYIKEFDKTNKELFKAHENKLNRLEYDLLSTIRKEKKELKEKISEAEIAKELQSRLAKARADLKAKQSLEYNQKLIYWIQTIEQDKIFYFVMATLNPQKVLVVKSPDDKNTAQKQFLGYTWSKAKNKEGIKYLGVVDTDATDSADEDNRILQNIKLQRKVNTPLFDANNAQNATKINYYIQQNFLNRDFEIPDLLQPFMSKINLVDLLDFSRKDFNKSLSLIPKKNNIIESKWELLRLGDEVELITKGTTPTSLGFQFTNSGINFIKIEAIFENGFIDKTKFAFIDKVCDEKLSRSRLKENDILFSIAGALGRTTIITKEVLPANTNQALAIIRLKENSSFLMKFLYLILRSNFIQSQIEGLKGGIAQPNLSLTQINDFKIPLPPLSIQQQIVAECEAIDQAVSVSEGAIVEGKKDIENIIGSINRKGYEVKKLSAICTMQAGKFVSAADINDKNEEGLYPCYGGNGLRGYTKTFTHEGEYPLIGRQGALCGNVHKVSGSFHATEHAVVVTPNVDINVNWLFYQLKALNLNQYATGTAQPGLSVNKVLTVTTPVPPLSEQEILASAIEKIELQIIENQDVINTSASAKQTIMKKYL